ncbi:MAG: replication initiator protein A [Chitinophagales bacterium]|nr:replication initiator protein A [Hyphomicrobiales bacterium]
MQDEAVWLGYQSDTRLRSPDVELRSFSVAKADSASRYEIARTHRGQQVQWTIGLDTLLKKTSSKPILRGFAALFASWLNTCPTTA